MAKKEAEERTPVIEVRRYSQEWDSRHDAPPPTRQTVIEVKRIGWTIRTPRSKP